MELKKTYFLGKASIFYKHRFVIISFLLAFIPRILLGIGMVPVRTMLDEVTTMAGAAYFSGNDWSAVISNSGYYGMGFTMLLAPVFKVTDNPFIIYQICIGVCALLQSMAAPICYYIMKKCWNINNHIYLCLVSVACSYMVVTRSNIIYNEQMLIFLSWVIALILAVLQNDRLNSKKTIFLTILLALVISYSLTIHTRALTFLIALAICFVIYFFMFRKKIFNVIAMVVTTGIGYMAGKAFIYFVKNNIWSIKEGTTLGNTSIGVDKGIQYLLSTHSWQAWGNIIFGQVNTISIITAGFILIAGVIVVHKCWESIIKRKKEIAEDKIMLIGLFFLVCIVMTIAAQSISWLKSTTAVLEMGFENNAYSTKGFTYVRYFGPYCGPMLMVGFAYAYNMSKRLFLRYYKTAALIWGGVTIYWVLCVTPYIAYSNALGTLEAYLPFALERRGGISSLSTILPATLITIIIFLINAFFYNRKKIIIPVLSICISLFYQYAYNAIVWDQATAETSIKKVEQSYEVLKNLKDKDILPHEFYVFDTITQGNHKLYYEYQFMFNRKKVIPGIPEESKEEAIVLANKYNQKELLTDEYKYFKISDSEYMYVKGVKLQEKIEKAGYKLESSYYYAENLENVDIIGENAYIDENGYICSYGNEGMLWSKSSLNITKGTYSITGKIEVDDGISEEIGKLELFNPSQNNTMVTLPITKNQINGDSSFEVQFECGIKESVELRFYSTAGNMVKVKDLSVNRLSNLYEVGACNEQEVDAITSFLGSINQDYPATFISTDEYEDKGLSLNYLQGKMLSRKVESIDYESFIEKDLNDDRFLIIENDISKVFGLVGGYTIINKTDHYTVLASSMSPVIQVVQINGGMILSEGKAINIKYFQLQNGIMKDIDETVLGVGSYNITSKIQLESTGLTELGNFGLETSNGYRENAEYIFDNGLGVATIQFNNYNNELRIGFNRNMNRGIEISSENIFIEKVSDLVAINLDLFSCDLAQLEEDGIVTTGQEGYAIKGPYFSFTPGMYKVKYHFEIVDFTENELAVCKVMQGDNSLGRVAVFGEDYETSEIDIEVPFSIVDGEQSEIEFVTYAKEGTIIKLKSIEVEYDDTK